MSYPNVLVSSAGRRVALVRAFRAALGDEGSVIATDASELSAASRDADAAFVSPLATSPDFVPFMLDFCVRERIGLVVPTIDTELPVWAEARELFAQQGTQVLVSDPVAISIASDKVLTNDFFVRIGAPTVRQASPRAVLMHAANWTFPLVAKPRGEVRQPGSVTHPAPKT